MSLTDTLNTMVTTVTGKALNRYRLDIPSCTADIDVEDFSGSEAMSELYCYTINFTSPDKNIDARQMLSKPATLTMGAGNLLPDGSQGGSRGGDPFRAYRWLR